MNTNKKKQTKEYINRHKLGQFFTSDELVDLITKTFNIDYSYKTILEPSFGGCAFIKYIVEHSDNAKITAIDIDKKLCDKYSKEYLDIDFVCKDFLMYQSNKKFDMVVGNPPFNLKTKFDYCNSTEGFLKKSLLMLKPGGCLYFVMPSTLLRNKQYQNLREFIVSNFKIQGIINTSKYNFLGADIETIVIGIKNEKVKKQSYFYLNNETKTEISLTINERCSILTKNTDFYDKLKNKIAFSSLGKEFDIFRGCSKSINCLRGRQINFHSHYLELSKKGEYFIGVQNIAYRFVSNLIKGSIYDVSDTITLLVPKENLQFKYICFISEYLNSSIANYLLHVNALNCCKLTIHIDKYYIYDIFTPKYDSGFDMYIKKMNQISNSSDVGKYRNNYFYKLFNLNQNEIDEIESLWTNPIFKEKIKYVLKEEKK